MSVTQTGPSLSVIIPANNESDYIRPCLDALVAQQGLPPCRVQIVVAANGCTDDTVAIAGSYEQGVSARGWTLTVLDLPQGGKVGALNRADAAATGEMRVYLDADVVMSPPLLADLITALDTSAPRYASGRLVVARAASAITRAYARVWVRVPFMTEGVPGAGLFAVNAAGRARWGDFPSIISDDTFVRLNFAPAERVGVRASYVWPMVEGFSNLVRVRRRQDVGVDEVARLYPDLMRNDDKPRFGLSRLLRIALSDPAGFAVYAAVSIAVRRNKSDTAWKRGR